MNLCTEGVNPPPPPINSTDSPGNFWAIKTYMKQMDFFYSKRMKTIKNCYIEGILRPKHFFESFAGHTKDHSNFQDKLTYQ